MKKFRNLIILTLIVSAGLNCAIAQTKSKKQIKEDRVSAMVKAKKYTFLANYVLPQRGGSRQLTSGYDLRITPDSVISFLPFFGRAYFGLDYASQDNGLKFTSTKFSYEVTEKKKGGWEITIKRSDVKYMNRLLLSISPDGYASLGVSTANRDYIDFSGYLK